MKKKSGKEPTPQASGRARSRLVGGGATANATTVRVSRSQQKNSKRQAPSRRNKKVGVWMPSEREAPKLVFGDDKPKAAFQSRITAAEKSLATVKENWWRNYGHYIQLLVLAAFFYFLAFLLMKNVSPKQVANWLFPNSYLVWQMLIAGGNFMLFTFLWQSRLLGMLSAGLFFSLLFFQLQQVALTWWVVLIAVLPWLIAIGFVLWRRYNKAHHVAVNHA